MLAIPTMMAAPNRKRFESSDQAEIIDFVSRTLAPHRMERASASPISVSLDCIEMASLHIVDIQYDGDVWIHPEELEDHFLVHAAVRGETVLWAGNERGVIGPDNLYISSPGKPLRIRMAPECRHLTVRIAQSDFEDYLSRVMHIATSKPLVFYPAREGNRELPAAWRNLMAHLLEQMTRVPALMQGDRIARQYSAMMIELLLSNYSNSYSDQIALYGNDVSPWHVRRAREIIHQELDDTICIADLASRVGVSVRSLQNGFRQFQGLTPIEYIRRCRLEKLHDGLVSRGPECGVTELMLECGIMNFGRYAQYYRQQYGCTPSETLRDRRNARAI